MKITQSKFQKKLKMIPDLTKKKMDPQKEIAKEEI